MASQRRLSMDKFSKHTRPTERTRRDSCHEDITGLSSDPQNVQHPVTKTKVTKEDIGSPTNFRHLTHVGWDSMAGSPPNTDYISSPSNFQHLTHGSQPRFTTVKSSRGNDYISSPTNFQHLTHISWDPMRSAPSNGIINNRQRWEKFISALIHHGDNGGPVKEKVEGEGRARTHTNEMQEVASTSTDWKAEVEKEKGVVHSARPVDRSFY